MRIRQQLWLGMGVAALVSGVLVLALGHLRVAPRTDRAAVMALLDARGIRYRAVAVRGGASDVPQDHYAYVAAVEVAAERPAYGKIVCQSGLHDCVVWIDSLGMHQVALPQVTPAEPWVEPLRRWLREAEQLVRSWLNTSPASRPGAGDGQGPRYGA